MNPTPAAPDKPRFCDLVMKGGITSGVVYPLAVFEIAKAFRLKNIGGTSAGAIAAAAAAAAEYGRYRNQGGGFAELAKLPAFLSSQSADGKGTHLLGFFQPQATTTALFNTCIAGLGGGAGAWWRVLAAGCRNFPAAFWLGTIPGALLIGLSRWEQSVVLGVIGAIAVPAGAVLAVILAFVLTALKAIPGNCFGLCNGMSGSRTTTALALTPWLTNYLNLVAGLEADGDPLTFKDLWTADPADGEPSINLEVVTTCLTHGRPYRMPFRDDDLIKDNKQFFYRRDEFAGLFPESVMRWLDAHRREFSDAAATAAREAKFLAAGFIPLPEPADLPVVVAVRMSLSFPILLSAVPLYAVDYSRAKLDDQWPERCWFSDGGLSSNFPIHFFDTALPRWPTFGIDLAQKHPDYDAGFYMPSNNAGGTLVKWTRFDVGTGVQRLLGFVSSIVMTSKDWADNAQCRLPGFRDRIGQISLTKADGGLNLTMPRDQIERLCEYGTKAGLEFVKRFATNPPDIELNWENHRQVRLRATLAAIEEWLVKLERSCSEHHPADAPYPTLIQQPAAKSYPWQKAQKPFATDLLQRLRGCAAALGAAPPTAALHINSPRPRPELRVRSRI